MMIDAGASLAAADGTIRIVESGSIPARRAPRGAGLRARVLAGGPDLAAGTGLVEIAIAPGRSLPVHAHGDAETVVYVVSGRARFLSGERHDEVTGGGVVLLPAGMRIAVTNSGVDILRLLAVVSPAGIEREFLGWPAAAEGVGGWADEPHALLDLRGLPRPQRNRTVIATLEALEHGIPLIVVADHEPAALRRQLERRYNRRLGWDVRERSVDRVEVAIWLCEPWPEPGDADADHALIGELSPAGV
jgi:uncharacterized protein (DUF2249 family)/quercetin dioxygenase-like cupin family protein